MYESTVDLSLCPEELQVSLRERLASGTLELPILPDVASQVLSMSDADNTDARALSDLIHRDQAIASHVLRLANSPAFRPRSPIVSLQQAVSRLGVKILREIVIAVSMQSRIFKVRGYERELQELWQHALATAAYNKEIARMRRQNVEVAFLCGLLHDVGKPVVLQCLTDLQRELGCELTSPGIFAALEAYHTQAGEQLASRWALPAEVCASIAYHHDYYITPTYFEAVRMTYLADCLSYTLMQPEPDIPALRQDAVWADLNFYPDDIEALLAKHETVVRFVEGMV